MNINSTGKVHWNWLLLYWLDGFTAGCYLFRFPFFLNTVASSQSAKNELRMKVLNVFKIIEIVIILAYSQTKSTNIEIETQNFAS